MVDDTLSVSDADAKAAAKRAKHAAYMREWCARNPDKVAKSRANDQESSRIRTKKRWVEHKERLKADVAAWRKKNKQREQQRAAAYYQANAERLREYHRQWSKENLHICRTHNAKRRARSTAGGNHIHSDVDTIFAAQKGKCVECFKSIKRGYHVDHRIPLALGGSNDRRNIQLLCAPCNWAKHAMHPVDFARRKGRLL